MPKPYRNASWTSDASRHHGAIPEFVIETGRPRRLRPHPTRRTRCSPTAAERENSLVSTQGDLVDSLDLRVLPAVEWRVAARAHRDRLDRLVGPYLERRAAGTTHPVIDFLFT